MAGPEGLVPPEPSATSRVQRGRLVGRGTHAAWRARAAGKGFLSLLPL